MALGASPCRLGLARRRRARSHVVEAGVKEAGLALAGPKPSSRSSARHAAAGRARGLPPMPFVRLIWKESRSIRARSAPRARKALPSSCRRPPPIAGLTIRSSPKSAIVHSASLLADLRQEFGNFGLAAAAYNAGAERVRGWLAGNQRAPLRDPGLCRIRHRARGGGMEAAETELPDALQDRRRGGRIRAEPRAARGARGVRDASR